MNPESPSERLKSEERLRQNTEAKPHASERELLMRVVNEMTAFEEDAATATGVFAELPPNDPLAKRGTERLESIKESYRDLAKRIASLHLSPESIREVYLKRAERTALPRVRLEYDNPQRASLESQEKYEAYIRQGLDEANRDNPPREVVNLSNAEDASIIAGQTFEDARHVTSEADRARQRFADRVHSHEYARRASANENLPPEVLEERKARSRQDNTYIGFPEVYPWPEDRNVVGEYHSDGPGADPRYADKIFLNPTNRTDEDIKSTAVHELAHRATRAEEGMSEVAKNLLMEGFNPNAPTFEITDDMDETTKKEILMWKNYVKNPTELDARRVQFIDDLTRLTDWKYGDPFTKEREEEALRLFDEGKLSSGGAEFLACIKPEYLQKIINTLAEAPVPDAEKKMAA